MNIVKVVEFFSKGINFGLNENNSVKSPFPLIVQFVPFTPINGALLMDPLMAKKAKFFKKDSWMRHPRCKHEYLDSRNCV